MPKQVEEEEEEASDSPSGDKSTETEASDHSSDGFDQEEVDTVRRTSLLLLFQSFTTMLR